MCDCCTTIYKLDKFKEQLIKELDAEQVSFDDNSTGQGDWIDDDFSTVFDCIVKAFEETTESKME